MTLDRRERWGRETTFETRWSLGHGPATSVLMYDGCDGYVRKPRRLGVWCSIFDGARGDLACLGRGHCCEHSAFMKGA